MAKERNKWIHIRVTDEERAAWQSLARAHQLTLAALIRSKMGEPQPTGRLPKRRKYYCHQADPFLIHQLARIGNNLNQVGKWGNTYKKSIEAVRICTLLIAIHRDLAQLLHSADQVGSKKQNSMIGEG
jgi:hypothetical protein